MIADAPQVSRGPICAAKGCDNLIGFYPTIKVWAKGRPQTPPIQIEVGMGFCREHQSYFHIDDLDLKSFFRHLSLDRHLREPDLASAKLGMKPIAYD